MPPPCAGAAACWSGPPRRRRGAARAAERAQATAADPRGRPTAPAPRRPPEPAPARLTRPRAGAAHHGLLLEDKGLSLAVHYRRAPRLGGYAHRLVRSLLAGTGGTGGGTRYAVQTGKRVVELKPA